ncbi:MAG: o-succinylbenzoate--CoA ligase [Verrucomicrobia bacterium]|nr:o-succinylbenzoate--CoA ligase [Verrucomicrobiota bacterium]
MDRAELKTLLRATGCVEERNGIFFLCDPRWGPPDRAAMSALENVALADLRGDRETGWLCIPTGGTGGGVRFARHDEKTLGAAVRGFCAHFGMARVNALDVLPAFHVSGLMARVRCAATGGQHVAWPWKDLEAGRWPAARADEMVLSLVPTQLQRLLESPEAVERLRGFRIIFVGGGPIWPGLADRAAAAGLRLSPSYGMTETAAMVAALRPEEFLAGDRTSGASLPHAQISISNEGLIRVGGESLFRGYFPDCAQTREFQTEDLGEFDAKGHLRILGRRDAVIITGGKKVHPSEVEAVLRASGSFADVAVIGLSDHEWGEIVVACFVAVNEQAMTREKLELIHRDLAPHQRPKRYLPVAEKDWPRNAQGKLNRATLRRLAMRAPGSSAT